MLIFFLSTLTSCSVGPPYQPPIIDVPEDWKNRQQEQNDKENSANELVELIDLDHWWQVFQDEKLDRLEALAIENNRNIFIAFERIQEARAIMGIAAANFYPQITLNPLFTDTNQLAKTYIGKGNSNLTPLETSIANAITPLSIFREHQMLYFLPLNLSYEVDLWGKIKDGYDSAAYNWLAQAKDYETIMLNLTSNLAITYYQLRAADNQIDLLLKVIQTRQKAFDINQSRYEEEISNYADVTLAGQELDSAIAQHYEVQRQREVLENQLAVLIGIPASEFTLEHLPLQNLPPHIPQGIPSEILLRRPDIAEAEFAVRSEHALIKQAYSQFFPSLVLTAATGFESPVLKFFLHSISRYWMNGTQINQLIFDGGRTSNNLHLQIASFEEATGAYQQQVLIAFQEVENALVNINSYADQYAVTKATIEWAQKSYQLYLDRYLLGVSYYIDVANTENALLNYQINLNTLQGFRYIATIELIKALGGGW